jgi:hypothetical protein
VVGKLLAVSRRLAETGDLAEVLSTVIDALRDLLDAERATGESSRRRTSNWPPASLHRRQLRSGAVG